MLRLAFRNVFRHKLRTGLTLASIVSGVVGLVLSGGFVEDSLVQLREATIHSQLGHLQIYRTGYHARGSQLPYQFLIEDPEPLLRRLQELPQVGDAMARLGFSGLLGNGRTEIPVIGTGMEPDKEALLGTSISIVAGRQLGGDANDEILLGEGVAAALKLGPGDTASLVVSAAGNALNTLDFKVAGIFRSFSKDYDSRAVRIPLRAAQELCDVKGANAIVLSLKETTSTDEVAALVERELGGSGYEIKTWNQLADFYEKTAALYQRQFAVLQVIILLAVLLSVANSVNMSIFERTGEFGTLMAMGDNPRKIFRQILLENVLLGLIGSGAGIAVGVLLAWAVSVVGIDMPPPPNSNSGYTAVIRVTPAILGTAFVVGLVATVLAALLPARRVSRLPPIEALRQNQ
jgi:putative ABC transport system permease protein